MHTHTLPNTAPHAYNHFNAYLPTQSLVENFESLSLGGPSGQLADAVDIGSLPRPAGEHRALSLAPQPPCDPGNCSPDCMRLTVNGVPNSTALRSRWVGGRGAGEV